MNANQAKAARFPYVGFDAGFAGAAANPLRLNAYHQSERHLFLVGPSGSGKGTRVLIPQLATLNRSILVIDPKGELAAVTARKRKDFGRVVILNPFGVHADRLPPSVGFNPLALLDPAADDFPDRAKGLSEAIIKVEGNDPHWSTSAQQLVAALIMFVRLRYGAAGSLVDVRRLLCEPSAFDKNDVPTSGLALTALTMIGLNYPPLTAKAGRFARDSKEIDSVVSTASTQTEFIDSLKISASLKGGGFDFAALKNETVTVFLILPAYELDAQSRWLRLIIVTALRALMQTKEEENRPARPPVLMILDEFAQLGHLAAIENAMGIARGYGIQLFPILQDINQLKDLYEKRWETFIGNAGLSMAFTPNDMTTAEYLSRRAGQEEVEKKSKGTSINFGGGGGGGMSANVGTQFEPIHRPEKLLGMGKGRLMCFHEGHSNAFFSIAPDYEDESYPSFLRELGLVGSLDKNPYRKAER